ncbi:YbaY family lipoprotein [Caulobacter sp. UNC358MFTsu5.1]|uniref:YbaY family lipoprotein n=1 Tax=Caulobacter sp. UNC358MFTsu5.1 TaxID=1449049 RepID=UPI0004A766A8|nr:YbaY family lipoprotein [Caulobacter sp. UNC358MFTsu5.1]
MKPFAPALLALTILTACAGASGTAPSGPSSAAVTGQVVWRERIMLPPQTKVIVRLQDVSLADAPAKVIAEAVIPAQTPPVAFSLGYDPAKIAPTARIAVSARVEVDGRLRFINDTHIPVINGGPTEGVEVLVKGVAP